MSDLSKGQTGAAKTARNPVKVIPITPLKKPEWIRVKAGNSQTFYEVKRKLRAHSLHTVCEEASCPNIGECFGKGTATFMILGDLCTRRCPFCDVAHGRPKPPDAQEPLNLARTVADLGLKYVVITSVDRDDLRDGGAAHFAECIRAVREHSPATRIEVLTPDFRGRLEKALDALAAGLPDVMNHNLETVPRLYRMARPGADYAHSLKLLKDFKARFHARSAQPRGQHAHRRPVPAADQRTSAGGALRRAGALQGLRARGAGARLRARGLRAAGALELSRGSAGARHRRGLTTRAQPLRFNRSINAARLVSWRNASPPRRALSCMRA
jgi:hypothetical protein